MRLGWRRERLYNVASGADLICASAPSWHSIDVLGRSDTSNEMPDDVEALKQRLQVSEAERDLLKLMVEKLTLHDPSVRRLLVQQLQRTVWKRYSAACEYLWSRRRKLRQV
jgi:hypothetical protein